MMWSILTRHCFLRDYGEEDREAFLALNTDAKARAYLGGALSQEEAEELFEQVLRDADPRHGKRWAVFERRSNAYLAHIFLTPWEDSKSQWEWGIIIQPEQWNHAQVLELGQAVREQAFSEMESDQLVATVDEHQGELRDLLVKLGMQRTQRFEDEEGRYDVMALARADYLSNQVAQEAS